MTRTRIVLTGVAAALSLATAAAVYAQPFGGAGPGFGPGGGPGMAFGMGPMGGPRGFGAVDPATFVNTRLDALKTQLNITPAQDAAWQSFAAKAKEQAAARQAAWTATQQPASAAPDLLAQRTELMKQRVAGMESMNAAMTDLYAVLSPEQKQLVDRGIAFGGGPRMGRAWRGL